MGVRALIAMSDLGGGHRAISGAIRGAMARLYGREVEATISDVFTLGQPTVFDDATRLYIPVLRHAPWLYGLAYRASEKPGVYEALARHIEAVDGRKIVDLLGDARPDVIVSVHPLANRPIIRARDALGLRVPIVAIVTELVTVHRSWVEPEIDLYTTATPESQAAVLRLGADPRRVIQTGLPVDERFGRIREEPAAIRERLGLDPSRFTVLLTGGGEGAGGLERVLAAADRAALDAQFVVVCGHNHRLRTRLLARGFGASNRILGFVDNMPELVHAADVVVAKGGPGVIAEALAGKRPLVLSSVTPGQEEGNGQFVERHGVGYAPGTVEGVVAALKRLADQPELRAQLGRKAARLGRPRAAARAARLIVAAAAGPDLTPLPPFPRGEGG